MTSLPRRLRAYAGALGLLLLGQLLPPQEALAQGLADPRESIAIFQAATAAGDIEAVMALYAPNAVLLFPNAPVIGGADQIRAVFQRNFAAGPNKLTIHRAQMDGNAETAVILWVWTYEVTPTGSQPVVRTGRSMVFFKRGEQGWLIHADMLQDAPLQ